MERNIRYVVDENDEIIAEDNKILVLNEDGKYMYINVSDLETQENHEQENSASSSQSDGHVISVSAHNISTEQLSANASNIPKLWTHESTVQLIELYKKYEKEFDTTLKKYVWQKVANELESLYHTKYTATQVDTKWKGLVKTYKDIRKHNNTTGKERKNWEYFKQMNEILYTRPEITAVATCSNHVGLKTSQRSNDTQNKNMCHEAIPPTASSFAVKRQRQESSIEKHHKEKMARLDKLQGSIDKVLELLERQHQRNESDDKR